MKIESASSTESNSIGRPASQPQVHYRVAEKDLPEFEFTGQIVSTMDDLSAIIPGWQRLLDTAVHANLFFAPDFLIPAIQHLGDDRVEVLVVQAPNRLNPAAPQVICGLVPLIKKRFYGMPISCREAWKHDQCFDCTPLIRRDSAKETLAFMFDYLGEQGTKLLSFDTISGEGDFQRILTEVIYEQGRSVFARDAFTRACFYPSADAETYIRAKVSPKTRKNTSRLERRLANLGNLQVEISDAGSDKTWVEDFLLVESRGWKGVEKTALSSNESSRNFFLEMGQRNLASGSVSLLKVSIDNQAISILCDLHNGRDAVHFKTTFDESFAQYSPGLIAELHNIERLHARGVRKMDSCADPQHSMINRVWPDRVRLQSLVVALDGVSSRFATATMPLIQVISKLIKK